MKTLIEITFSDDTVITREVPMDRREVADKLGVGKYAMVYGRPKLIKESRVLCWDIR